MFVTISQPPLRVRILVRGGIDVIFYRRVKILLYAAAVLVTTAYIGHSAQVTERSRFFIIFQCLNVVFFNAVTTLVAKAEVAQRALLVLLGGFFIPVNGFIVIEFYAVAIFIAYA